MPEISAKVSHGLTPLPLTKTPTALDTTSNRIEKIAQDSCLIKQSFREIFIRITL